jgi:hypothetical protein
MTATIETTHLNIEKKIHILYEIFKTIRNANVNIDGFKIEDYEKLLKSIEINYQLEISLILDDYYNSSKEKKEVSKQYYLKIYNINIHGDLQEIVHNIKKHLNKVGDNDLINKINKDFQKFNSYKIHYNITKHEYSKCHCGNDFTIRSKQSQFKCDDCGSLTTIRGTVFEDNQFYSQDLKKSKHGLYRKDKFAEKWINKVQGKYELKNINFETILFIRSKFAEVNKDPAKLSCADYRKFFADYKLTYYNDYAPYVKKLVSGVQPIEFYKEEEDFLMEYLPFFIDIFNIIKEPSRKKSLYTPYFIYKLYDGKYPESQHKRDMIDAIHLQSDDTLAKNDITWSIMCKKAGDEWKSFNKPTIRPN